MNLMTHRLNAIPSAMPVRNRVINCALLVAAVVCLQGLAIGLLPAILLSLLSHAFIDAVFASSLGMLHRHTGRISFGHAAYFGLAIYLVALLLNRGVVSAEVAILLAILLPTLFGFAMGLLIARIPGVAHAMLTLATGQALYEVAFKWRSVTNGDDGLAIAMPRSLFGLSSEALQAPEVMFAITGVVLLLVLMGLSALARSPFGTLTEAIRDNMERVEFLGYGVKLPCALIYAASACVAATAGVLFALANAFVTPTSLHWSTSGACLVMAIIGGTRIIWGPALGALVFFFLKDVVGDISSMWPAIVGIVLVVITLALPEGLSAPVQKLLSTGINALKRTQP